MDEYNPCISCGKTTNITVNLMPFCNECKQTQTNQLRTFDDNKSKFFPEIDKITDTLYLGNEDMGRDKDKLKELGITHILLCGSSLVDRHPNDFKYKRLELDDSLEQNIKKYFAVAFKFIDSAVKVFVHCAAGVSRSATIVISYLIITLN